MTQVKIQIADLDHDGVYWGLKPALLEELAAGAVVFCAAPEIVLPEGVVWAGQDCDLAPGSARWNAKTRSFDLLPVDQRKAVQAAPTLERALLDFLEANPAATRPVSTQAWIDFQKTTIDEKGRE